MASFSPRSKPGRRTVPRGDPEKGTAPEPYPAECMGPGRTRPVARGPGGCLEFAQRSRERKSVAAVALADSHLTSPLNIHSSNHLLPCVRTNLARSQCVGNGISRSAESAGASGTIYGEKSVVTWP